MTTRYQNPRSLREYYFCKYREQYLKHIKRRCNLTTLLRNPSSLHSEKPGVYIIVRRRDLYPYVGESFNMTKRLIQHATQQYPTQYIDRQIKQEGPEAFWVGILEFTSRDQKERRKREKHYVRLLNSYYNGFNGSVDGHPKGWLRRNLRHWIKRFFQTCFNQSYRHYRQYARFKHSGRLWWTCLWGNYPR